MSAVERQRPMAMSFGAEAERYDRTRPAYPADMIRRVLSASSGRDVLDVGCGTGTVARQFRDAGCRVLGLEPDVRMAALVRRSGIEVVISAFESWDAAGRQFDVVSSGMAWHWIDPLAGAWKAAQLLRPGGVLAVFWHLSELPRTVRTAFLTAYQQVVAELQLDVTVPERDQRSAVERYQEVLSDAANGARKTGCFAEVDQHHFGWEAAYTKAAWLDQLPSHGALTLLPAVERAHVIGEVGAAIDELGGSMTVQYLTVAVIATRRAGASGTAGVLRCGN
ncbi:class I SAM-dependent methyltransferase [Kribbella sp. NPDC054772]